MPERPLFNKRLRSAKFNMSGKNISLFLLRVSFGWLMFYAGITKILNPSWTAAGYLSNAKTFPALFGWLASPDIIGIVNFLNEWGLTLIGVSLILGILVRPASVAGVILMLLYYFPVLDWPTIGTHSYIIDEHIIYVLIFAYFVYAAPGKIWGLDKNIAPRFIRSRRLIG